MSKLGGWIWRACAELGLRVELDFHLTLSDKVQLRTVARLPDLGARNGMLLVQSHEDVRNYSRQLLDAGYGYSALDEPAPSEEFDLDAFREMFIDWGWSGELGRKPTWMR